MPEEMKDLASLPVAGCSTVDVEKAPVGQNSSSVGASAHNPPESSILKGAVGRTLVNNVVQDENGPTENKTARLRHSLLHTEGVCDAVEALFSSQLKFNDVSGKDNVAKSTKNTRCDKEEQKTPRKKN
eukprot:4265121-Ditylum_brightwellii.AAC.1